LSHAVSLAQAPSPAKRGRLTCSKAL
jgi:hypothetical protein